MNEPRILFCSRCFYERPETAEDCHKTCQPCLFKARKWKEKRKQDGFKFVPNETAKIAIYNWRNRNRIKYRRTSLQSYYKRKAGGIAINIRLISDEEFDSVDRINSKLM